MVWDAKGLWGFTDPRVVFFEDFLKQGDAFLRRRARDGSTRRSRGIAPEDTAMIIYTSGTTGTAQGRHALPPQHPVHGRRRSSRPYGARRDDEVISYLPLAHIYENLISVFRRLRSGYVVNFVESLDTLFQNLREVSPTYFASVPRIWEKLASTIELRMADSTWLKRTLYRLAVEVGRRWERGASAQGPVPASAARSPAASPTGPSSSRSSGGSASTGPGSPFCGAAPASPELFELLPGAGRPARRGLRA